MVSPIHPTNRSRNFAPVGTESIDPSPSWALGTDALSMYAMTPRCALPLLSTPISLRPLSVSPGSVGSRSRRPSTPSFVRGLERRRARRDLTEFRRVILACGPGLTSTRRSALPPLWKTKKSSASLSLVLKFPNPGAAGPPYYQLWWSDPSAGDSQIPGRNGWYINQGQRWMKGKWPEGEHPFFDRTQPCR